MEVFNIGPFEFLIILVIMFVLLGPDEMKRTARRIAIAIRKFVRSPIWADITGMREEIRELPKRLMEDTGLDEAVQDIKQTTTAASEEMNAAVKESVEAARVREVENLRVMTPQKLSPTAGQVIMPPRKPKESDPSTENGDEAAQFAAEVDAAADAGASEFAESANAQAAELAAAAHAYTLEVDIAPATHEPAQDQPIADTVNTITPPAEVVKKPRRKKAVVEPAEAPADADAPAPKPRRAPRKKTETETPPSAPGTNGSAADESTPTKDETNQPNAA